MSSMQSARIASFMGRSVSHFTGRTGVCVGGVVGKKGKGIWLLLQDDNGCWHQYFRCR
jgi:hypothetical protein